MFLCTYLLGEIMFSYQKFHILLINDLSLLSIARHFVLKLKSKGKISISEKFLSRTVLVVHEGQ